MLPGARGPSVDKFRGEAGKPARLVPMIKGGRSHPTQPVPQAMYPGSHSSLANGADPSKASVIGAHANNNMLKLSATRKATPTVGKPLSQGALNGKPGSGTTTTHARLANVEVKVAPDSLALGVSNPSSKPQAMGKAPETPGSAKRGASNRNDFFKSLKKEASTMTHSASDGFKPSIRSGSSSDSAVSPPTSPVAEDAIGRCGGPAVLEAAKPPSVVTTDVEYELFGSSQLTRMTSAPIPAVHESAQGGGDVVQPLGPGELPGSAVMPTASSPVTPAVHVSSTPPPPAKIKSTPEVLYSILQGCRMYRNGPHSDFGVLDFSSSGLLLWLLWLGSGV